MATPLNLEVLEQMGFALPATRPPTTWWWRSGSTTTAALDAALAAVDRALTDDDAADVGGATRGGAARTTGAALRDAGADALVLVSVPGASAAVEAMDALDAGRDVMVFSDNVPVEQEVALKTVAAARGLLVMGPDCGTAVVGGLGLGLRQRRRARSGRASSRRPAPAASRCSPCSTMPASASRTRYGVGGRDLSAEVGGLATRDALRRLDADPVGRAGRADLQAAGRRRRGASSRRTPVAGHAGRAGAARSRPARPDRRRRRTCCGALGRDVPAWPVARRGRARHHGHAGCTGCSSAAP